MKKTFGKSNVFWGVAFIASALLLITDAVGRSAGVFDLPVLKIILCTLIAAWGISELVKKRISHIFLPIGFIFIILQKDISIWVGRGGEKFVSVWVVILAAVLLQAGTSVLLPKKYNGDCAVGTTGGNTSTGSDYFENDLGSSACYVDAMRLGYYRVENDLGKLDVYIENTNEYTGGGTIEVDNDLGQTTIHVPAGWAVDNRIVASLGGVSCSVPASGGPILTLVGSCDLGHVNII